MLFIYLLIDIYALQKISFIIQCISCHFCFEVLCILKLLWTCFLWMPQNLSSRMNFLASNNNYAWIAVSDGIKVLPESAFFFFSPHTVFENVLISIIAVNWLELVKSNGHKYEVIIERSAERELSLGQEIRKMLLKLNSLGKLVLVFIFLHGGLDLLVSIDMDWLMKYLYFWCFITTSQIGMVWVASWF